MFRLVISSLIAIIVSYIGVKIKAYYHRRVRYLGDYMSFLDDLVKDISVFKSPLIDFISRCKEHVGKDFKVTLNCYERSIKENIDLDISNSPLNKRNIKIIQNCLNQIGRTNQNTEIYNLKQHIVEAESMLKRAKDDEKMKGNLYSKLLILLGIALLILLV